MKRFNFLTVILFLTYTYNCHTNEVVNLTNGEWAPYLSEHSKHSGYYSHIVSEAYAEVGIRVKYGFFPWKRTIVLAQKAKWNGAIGFSISEERKKIYAFSDKIAESCVVIFHLKNYAFDWQTKQDFKNHIFGGTKGYKTLTKIEEIKKSGVDLSIQKSTTDLKNFKKLSRGRITVFPCNREVGLGIIKKKFSSKGSPVFTYQKKPFYCSTYHVGFPKHAKRSKHFQEMLNHGLQLIHKNGKHKQLNENFINGEYDIK